MTDVYQRNEESLSQQDSLNPATIRICSVFQIKAAHMDKHMHSLLIWCHKSALRGRSSGWISQPFEEKEQ